MSWTFSSIFATLCRQFFLYPVPTFLVLQVSKEPLEVERSTGLFDANSELFKKTIMISMAMLSCGIMLGLCWEVIYRIRKKRKVEPHSQGNSIYSSNLLLVKWWPWHRPQPSLSPAHARFFLHQFLLHDCTTIFGPEKG